MTVSVGAPRRGEKPLGDRPGGQGGGGRIPGPVPDPGGTFDPAPSGPVRKPARADAAAAGLPPASDPGRDRVSADVPGRGEPLFPASLPAVREGEPHPDLEQELPGLGRYLRDQVLATAILDRLLHHATTVNIKGESYRLKEKRRAGLLESKALPPEEPEALEVPT